MTKPPSLEKVNAARIDAGDQSDFERQLISDGATPEAARAAANARKIQNTGADALSRETRMADAQEKKNARKPNTPPIEPISFEAAFTKLFPGAGPAGLVPPRRSRAWEKPNEALAIDVFIEQAAVKEKTFPKLSKERLGERGITCPYHCARAGVYIATVAAFLGERAEQSFKSNAAYLEDIRASARMVEADLVELLQKIDIRHFATLDERLWEPGDANSRLTRRHDAWLAFQGIGSGCDALINLQHLAKEEIDRAPPLKASKANPWAPTFVESLREVWRDLTGDYPRPNSPAFKTFAKYAYVTIATDLCERDSIDKSLWSLDHDARKAGERNAARTPTGHFDMKRKQPLSAVDFLRSGGSHFPHRLRMTQHHDPLIKAGAILEVENLRRSIPQYAAPIEAFAAGGPAAFAEWEHLEQGKNLDGVARGE